MESSKRETLKKITKLEEVLANECTRKNRKEIGRFTVMFDEESGRSVKFVKKMPLECTGGMEELYDRDSKSFNDKYRDVEWPYTGYVQGNIMGWYPISIPRLAEWLTKYGYALDEFIESFRSNP